MEKSKLMKYDLDIGQIVSWKCKVIGLENNCVVRVEGANIGEESIKFIVHPNSLKPYNKLMDADKKQ